MYSLNGQTLKEGQAFEDSNGKFYPSNWLKLSTQAEKDAVGIVTSPTPAPTYSPYYDQRFYWGPDLPKDLDGLKLIWIDQAKNTANTLLQKTDWIIIRSQDPSAAIPVHPSIQDERSLIRTRCNEKETEINLCNSVPELQTYVTSSSYNNWSKEEVVTPGPEPDLGVQSDSGSDSIVFDNVFTTDSGSDSIVFDNGFTTGGTTTVTSIFSGSGEDTLTFS